MRKNTDQYKNEFLKTLTLIAKDERLLVDFTKDILTPKELDTIATRWQIVKKLAKGEHHHAIAGDLGLGVATVTRGSREMRKEHGGIRRALRYLKMLHK